MKTLFFLLFVATFFLETTITTLPLMFILVLFLTLIYRNYWIFAIGFLAGILLDSSLFRMLGLSSLFFVSFIFIVLAYQRKFEIFTAYFVFAASFLGSFAYLLLTGNTNWVIFQTLVVSVISLMLFGLIRKADIKVYD